MAIDQTTAGRLRESLQAQLSSAGTQTGPVHLYDRFDGDWERYLDLFQTVVGDRKTLRGWIITRAGAEGNVGLLNRLTQRTTLQGQARKYVFVIEGMQKLEDSRGSELEFEALVEQVQDAIDSLAFRSRLVTEGLAIDSTPSDLVEWSKRPVGSTICHYARLLVAILSPRIVAA